MGYVAYLRWTTLTALSVMKRDALREMAFYVKRPKHKKLRFKH